MRRQRRAAELQDKRDRQKMGLLPPDPPKSASANLLPRSNANSPLPPSQFACKT